MAHGFFDADLHQVFPQDLNRFHVAYGLVLEASVPNLRKRDKKRGKDHAERAAQAKKCNAEPVIIEGANRSTGHRKRRGRIKAAIKQEAAPKRFKTRQTKVRS